MEQPLCEIPLSRTEIIKNTGSFPGCYAAFNAEGTCLYIGRSKQIRVRLLHHYIDQQDGSGIQWRLTGITEWFWKRPFAPDGCTLKIWVSEDYMSLERKLISELNPVHNKHYRKKD